MWDVQCLTVSWWQKEMQHSLQHAAMHEEMEQLWYQNVRATVVLSKTKKLIASPPPNLPSESS